MKKHSLIALILILFMAACGNGESKKDNAEPVTEPERKENITNAETMDYLEQMIGPFLDTQYVETDEDMESVSESMRSTATEVRRELKRDYEKGIHAVDDLVEFSDKLLELSKDIQEGNAYLMTAHAEELGQQIFLISTEYLDGDLPENYAEVYGADNVYDID